MRPGQAAPVFRHETFPPRARHPSFNEAGAGCPGIRRQDRGVRQRHRRFNEAGAGCPGIPIPPGAADGYAIPLQ